MKTLDQIAIEQDTDKSSKSHFYTQYYSMFFDRLRYDEINLMEIGVWTGSSLRMWEEYFENGKIFAIDYEDKSQHDTEITKTFISDQEYPNQIAESVLKMPPLDIIIDDASHLSRHQISSFVTLFPLLKPGGMYCVEDCLTSYNSTFCKPNEMSFIDYAKGLVGTVNMNGKIEDLVSDKHKAIKKYSATYFELNIEWVFTSCGLTIIKKIK